MNRREFVTTVVGAAAASVAKPAAGAVDDKTLRIVGVSCSPRKGKTTSAAVQIALEAAKQVNPRIKTEFIDLGGYNFPGWMGSGATPDVFEQPKDDFDIFLPMLQQPAPDGLIIGSPTYFRSMSALCKAFLERMAVLRVPELLLADRPVGALAVGSYRNGGQELVIEQILTAMLCYEMMAVGGKPKAHQGATLWNNYNDDITKDTYGVDSAKKLGIRVAEAALKLRTA
jgi:multimeric flavodoxin WrbA